jgi:hypothetical protein
LADPDRKVAGRYGSWREYADDYLAARALALGGSEGPGGYPASQQQTVATLDRLLDESNSASPWNRVSWKAGASAVRVRGR